MKCNSEFIDLGQSYEVVTFGKFRLKINGAKGENCENFNYEGIASPSDHYFLEDFRKIIRGDFIHYCKIKKTISRYIML